METARSDTALPEADDLHARDFDGWTMRQAELMRAGRFSETDVVHLVEEIETLGNRKPRLSYPPIA